MWDFYGSGRQRQETWNINPEELQRKQQEHDAAREPPIKDVFARRGLNLSTALQTLGRFSAEDGSFRAELVEPGVGKQYMYARVSVPNHVSGHPASTKPILFIAVPVDAERAKQVGAQARSNQSALARMIPGAERILDAHTVPGNDKTWLFSRFHRLTPKELHSAEDLEPSLTHYFIREARKEGVNELRRLDLMTHPALEDLVSRLGYRTLASGVIRHESAIPRQAVLEPVRKKEPAIPSLQSHSPSTLYQIVQGTTMGKPVTVQGAEGKPEYTLTRVFVPHPSRVVAKAEHARGYFSFVTLGSPEYVRNNGKELLAAAAREGLTGPHPAPLVSIQVDATARRGAWTVGSLFDLGFSQSKADLKYAFEGLVRDASSNNVPRVFIPEQFPFEDVRSLAVKHGFSIENQDGYHVLSRFKPRPSAR